MNKLLYGYLVLCFWDSDSIIISKSNKIYLYNINKNTYSHIASLTASWLSKIIGVSKLLRRLLRSDVRIAVKISKSEILAVYDSFFFRINIHNKTFKKTIKVTKGSRPLNITLINNLNSIEDGIYFGEYFSNPKKQEVQIYKYQNDKIKKVFSFQKNQINHIHNLIIDKYRDCVWVLAGDFDDGASIHIMKDNFKEVQTVFKGKQEYRSCVAFPVEEGLIYATDSQFEENSINIIKQDKNKNWITEKICSLNGPSIFGCVFKNKLVFSTSVEAINKGTLINKILRRKSGPGIIKDHSEIVIGDLKNGFSTIFENAKDIFPFIPFQFGNIIFPTGKNETGKLIFSNIALKKNDLSTQIILVNEI